MVRLDNKILVIFCILFCIQGCSIDGMMFGGASKKNSTIKATDNRRIPDQNPTIDKNERLDEVKNDISVQYLDDDNQQAYQDYKANEPPKDFTEFRKKQIEAELKVRRLNQSMDRAISLKESQITDEPIKIDDNSNLKEVIDYNKKQQISKNTKSTSPSLDSKKKHSKKEENNSCEAVISSSKSINNQNKEVTVVTIKPPVELQTPVKPENVSKSDVKKKDLEKKSNPVTLKQQAVSSSNKHKSSDKPVVNKKDKKEMADAKPAPVAPVIITKEEKKKPIETLKPADIAPLKKEIPDAKPAPAAPVIIAKEEKKKPIETLKPADIAPLKKEMADAKPAPAAPVVITKEEEKKPIEALKEADIAPLKKEVVDAKPAPIAPVDPKSINFPVDNKDNTNEIPITYLVIDPLDAADGSATAEVPNKERELVKPPIKEKKPEGDLRNLSHEEFKKALKEKFQKNNAVKHVDASEIDNTSPIEIIDSNPSE